MYFYNLSNIPTDLKNGINVVTINILKKRGFFEAAINFFLVSGDICCMLINLANSSDPDLDPQNVGSDLDPNHLPL